MRGGGSMRGGGAVRGGGSTRGGRGRGGRGGNELALAAPGSPAGGADTSIVEPASPAVEASAAAAEAVTPSPARSTGGPKRRVADPDLNNKRIIKVSKESDIKKVAGSISHIIRETSSGPVILASGPASVNQTVKALAVARKYLEQEASPTDIFARPHFDGTSPRLTLAIRVQSGLVLNGSVDDALMVKPFSVPSKVAGAIAGRIRDNAEVRLVTVGMDGVFLCIDAIATARSFLLEDNLDLEFSPYFVQLEWDGRTSNGLCFQLLATPI